MDLVTFKNENYPVTDKAYKYGFYVPSGMGLTEEEMQQVVNAVKQEINALSK